MAGSDGEVTETTRWVRTFKIALLEEDADRLARLTDSMPSFDNIEEMQAALALLQEASKRFERKKASLAKEMLEVREAKKFLTSSDEESPLHKQLDIRS